jgi:hypothetical protein
MNSPSLYFRVLTRNLTILDIKIHAHGSNVRRMKDRLFQRISLRGLFIDYLHSPHTS